MASVDVVVVNYNAGECLPALLAPWQGHPNIKVTLVDNASEDGSQKKAEKQVHHLIQNSKNKGFATACNQGAAHGTADVLFFVNPDCLLPVDVLQEMADRLLQSKAALMGCCVVNLDGSLQRGTWRRLPTLWRVLVTMSGLERLGIRGINLSKPPSMPEAVNGACYAIKRQVFESVGGFDPEYPLHFEDLDLFARLVQAGHRLACANDIQVKHIKGHSSTDTKQVAIWKKQGLLRFFERHRPRWEVAIIRFLSILR